MRRDNCVALRYVTAARRVIIMPRMPDHDMICHSRDMYKRVQQALLPNPAAKFPAPSGAAGPHAHTGPVPGAPVQSTSRTGNASRCDAALAHNAFATESAATPAQRALFWGSVSHDGARCSHALSFGRAHQAMLRTSAIGKKRCIRI